MIRWGDEDVFTVTRGIEIIALGVWSIFLILIILFFTTGETC